MRNGIVKIGRISVKKSLIEFAKWEIADIETSDLSTDEKRNKIRRVISLYDKKLESLKNIYEPKSPSRYKW